MSSHLYSGNGERQTGEALVSGSSLVVHSIFLCKIKLCGLVDFTLKVGHRLNKREKLAVQSAIQ